MKYSIFYLFVFILLVSCANNDPKHNVDKIDNYLKNLVDDKKIAGVSFGISVNDSINLFKEYGLIDVENKTTLNKENQFRIASITKPITAVAVIQLIESGKLSYDETIDKFFPDFPNAEKITIYQLLSHTSGIPNWWEGEMPEDEPKNFPMCESPHKYLQKMKTPSFFEAGTHYYYSNTGFILLGEIIEIISGLSYSDFIKENILIPSTMKNTELEYIEKNSANWVKGYAWNPENENPFVKPDVYSMPFSAGGLRSTVQDLFNFMKALYTYKLISKESLIEMTSFANLKNGKPVYENIFSPFGNSINFPSNINKFGYGLGFQLMENFGAFTISHGGDIAGFNSVLMFVPKSNTTLVILANTENGLMSKLKNIEKAIIQIEIKN